MTLITLKEPVAVAAALKQIERTFTGKSADYAEDTDWRSNFRDMAKQLHLPGVTDRSACELLIALKQSRLRALRANGRDPSNEGTLDTLLDRAVYAVIAFAMALEDG